MSFESQEVNASKTAHFDFATRVAPLTTDGQSSKRSMPTTQTGTGSLSYDSEGELPTSGK